MRKIHGNLLQEETPVVNNLAQGLVIGNRISEDYFITDGIGESNITVHAGSYHLALKKAGIDNTNIMTYSSILPVILQEIKPLKNFIHRAVMETIMAVANGVKNELVTAGIIFGWLYDRLTGEKYGGLVCEHNGNYTNTEIDQLLKASLNELYSNGYADKYVLKDKVIFKRSFVPKKEYGTALVAICLTNYLYPIINRA